MESISSIFHSLLQGALRQCGSTEPVQRRASCRSGVTKRTYWTTDNCLPVILPHVSTARLEQPVEKIPVYFQKQIKAFRLCSANLSLKAAGKICSLPLSLTPRPLQVRTFRPASPPPPLSSTPPTPPQCRLTLPPPSWSLSALSEHSCLGELETMEYKLVKKKKKQLVQGEPV